MKALIIVDIQNDFLKNGSLAVPEGEKIIPLINHLQEGFDLIVATQDWHPKGHKSFASSHMGKSAFEKIMLDGLEQILWPVHCVRTTRGSDFHPSLEVGRIEAIFRKGTDPMIDSYSGFFDNGRKKNTGLAGFLRDRKVNNVYVCGLAGDFCVFYTAKDAVTEGFETFLIEDATRPISPESFSKAKTELQKLGGKIIQSNEVVGQIN